MQAGEAVNSSGNVIQPCVVIFHAIALQIVVKTLPGSGLKVPDPPDKLTFSIAYCQPKVGMLVILNSDTVIR